MKYIISESSSKLKEYLRSLDFNRGVELVGGENEYVQIAYDGDLELLSKKFPLVVFDKQLPKLQIHRILYERMNLPKSTHGLDLGKFVSKRGYLFTSCISRSVNQRGFASVIGWSGDYGWGISFIPQRNISGKREKLDIMNQVIQKYDLTRYM
jgi:hypothetical protein